MEDKSLAAVFEKAHREYAAKKVDEDGSKSAHVKNQFFSVTISKLPREWKRGPLTTFSGNADDLENHFRRARRSTVERFNKSYVYGAVNSNDERRSYDCRTVIWSGGCQFWSVPSSGITWVAVRGKDSICVVIKNQEVDKARLQPFVRRGPNDCILLGFMRTILHEMEDPSSDLQQRFEKYVKNTFKRKSKRMSIMRTFAAVSVAMDSDRIHEESGPEVSNVGGGAQAAIDFLTEEIENDPPLTYEKTIQKAISAFQYLHLEKLQASDILVSTWMKDDHDDEYLVAEDIEKHLAVICKEPSGSTAFGCSKKLKR